MRKIFYVLPLALSLILTACSSEKEETSEAKVEEHNPDLVEFTDEQFQTVGVKFGNVSTTNLSNYIKASGTIDVPPQDFVSITAPYGGIIRSTNVIEGKYVTKGQEIATLENPEFVQVQQDYMETSSQITFLQQDLSRQEDLVKENIAARKSLQRATSEYNSMNARLEGLKAKLRIMNINPASVKAGNFTSVTKIHAPTSGYITHVFSNVGKFVGSNELLADMANTRNIMIRVKVFEKDLPNLKIGQKVRFRATGDSVERIARVFLIGKDIDTDRTVEVHAKIEALTPNMLPGMFINAIVEIGTSSTPALPQEAVVPSGGKHYIFLESAPDENDVKKTATSGEKHHSFVRVEVGTGVTENGFTAVILPEKFDFKSKVVIKGAYDLLSKMNNSEEEGH
ncbi:efflux RND transporter periplasmic adaptor subunit [Sediminibacterium ginsengisoli]|uniref:Membrane fusion protein, cobalt-zinc-cadmium efflux system n=1 Tax=Sediminibacterium ginsengisoli TaxID=413434 RepID=A0A1T4P2R6_9BACT|nr:efflux RND transporter periplasmic adaptor subunit [Sediminibacterium ginsengisoli]SJZ85712.1 membrane fusion protein, cobalt-zinc-cadmium efflux system [Sediminibacterium ginsengisoli]